MRVERLSLKQAVGLNLLAVRNALSLTQEEMGKVLGVSGRAVGNYETGTRMVQIQQALLLKQVHGVPLDWIYTGDISGCRPDLAKKIRDARDAIR